MPYGGGGPVWRANFRRIAKGHDWSSQEEVRRFGESREWDDGNDCSAREVSCYLKGYRCEINAAREISSSQRFGPSFCSI